MRLVPTLAGRLRVPVQTTPLLVHCSHLPLVDEGDVCLVLEERLYTTARFVPGSCPALIGHTPHGGLRTFNQKPTCPDAINFKSNFGHVAPRNSTFHSSTRVTSALFSRSDFTQPAWPLRDARCSGVHPCTDTCESEAGLRLTHCPPFRLIDCPP